MGLTGFQMDELSASRSAMLVKVKMFLFNGVMEDGLLDELKVEKFKHVDPSKEYTDSINSFLSELHRESARSFKGYGDDFSWLEDIEKQLSGLGGRSRKFEGVKLLVRTTDNEVVGAACIRPDLDEEALRTYGGNISHVIRPSERRKGYNKINLYLALCECKRLGMKHVIMTATKSNDAGARSIRAMGGMFVRDLAATDEDSRRSEEYMIRPDDAIAKYKDVFDYLIEE